MTLPPPPPPFSVIFHARSYSQSLAAVTAARGELERLGVSHRRPADYLAEMLKTDEHMKRVKDRLIEEQTRIKAVEARRRRKESGAFSKAVAAERSRGRAAEKRETLESIKQWRKHGTGGGALGLDEDDGAGAQSGASASGRGGGRGGRGGGRGGGGLGRRAAKDEKFGFGGRKKGAKSNSRESTRSGNFSSSKNRALPAGFSRGGGGGGRGGGRGGSRPGKMARVAGRGRK